jgi:nicotinamidase/pyrazinamidase
VKALLLVDLQNDFMPGGALAVAHGNEVIPLANRLMPQYDLVVATQDWHPANHQSFASQHPGLRAGNRLELANSGLGNIEFGKVEQTLWPDHCVQGTPGAAFAPALNIAGIDRVFCKGTDPNVDSYSAFFDNAHRRATGLEQYLHEHHIDELHVEGVATDYCVKFSVLDALRFGFETIVLTAGIRGVELQDGDCQRALDEMQAAGAKIR